MYSMRHVKGAAMNLKAEELEGYKEAMDNWLKNNDFEGVVQKADIKYTYDHIAIKLISQHAWVRVPHWIPGVEIHPQEGIVWEQKKI